MLKSHKACLVGKIRTRTSIQLTSKVFFLNGVWKDQSSKSNQFHIQNYNCYKIMEWFPQVIVFPIFASGRDEIECQMQNYKSLYMCGKFILHLPGCWPIFTPAAPDTFHNKHFAGSSQRKERRQRRTLRLWRISCLWHVLVKTAYDLHRVLFSSRCGLKTFESRWARINYPGFSWKRAQEENSMTQSFMWQR